VARLLLPATVKRILANLHNLVQAFTRSERLADQLNASILKTLIKLYVLKRNNMFNECDLQLFDEFGECLESMVKTFVKLYVNYTFITRLSFIRGCKKCQKLLHDIIANRQTRESHERIDYIFNFLSNTEFLKYVFDAKPSINHAIVKDLIIDMGSLMDERLI
jgi:hypothetical protein